MLPWKWFPEEWLGKRKPRNSSICIDKPLCQKKQNKKISCLPIAAILTTIVPELYYPVGGLRHGHISFKPCVAETVELGQQTCQAPSGSQGWSYTESPPPNRVLALSHGHGRLRIHYSTFLEHNIIIIIIMTSVSQAGGGIRGDSMHQGSGTQ